MIVIVANSLPPAIRGKLKLWFVEPKPNVFVSGIKDSLADRVVELVLQYAPESSGLLVFKSTREPPFYRIYAHGTPAKTLDVLTGFQLIADRNDGFRSSEPDF